MFEDYYKILNLKPNASKYKIVKQYLKLVNQYHSSIQNSEKDYEDYYRVNRAIEVLKNDLIRKYYDILYIEQSKYGLDLNNHAIQKYLEIVREGINAGNQKAELLLNNSEYKAHSGIIQTPKIFWLNFLVYINPNLVNKYLLLPILCLIYLIAAVLLILKQINNYHSYYLLIGILFSILSIIILYVNFTNYIIGKVSK